MNKTSRNYFLLAFLFLAILVFTYCNKSFGQANKWADASQAHRSEMKITYDTAQPKYFLKLPYSQDQFRKKIDTIYQVTMQLGKSMTVDQSEQLKGFVLSVIGRFSNDAKIDSTKK